MTLHLFRRRRSRWGQSSVLARSGTAVLCAFLMSCSDGDEAALEDGPVFALDRAVTHDIEAVDPDRTDVLSSPTLRLALQQLLTEHSDLSVEAMGNASDGISVDSTLAALTNNTDELTRAIGLVYGPQGAEAFDQLWTNHIEFFNDYATAVGAGDEAAVITAVEALEHYENDFSSYIDAATASEVDFHAVLHVLHSHVAQLLDQSKAWSSGDVQRADELSQQAHRHMDVIARALATGIAVQQPLAFPGEVGAGDNCAAALLDGTAAIERETSGEPDPASARSAARSALVDALRSTDDCAGLL